MRPDRPLRPSDVANVLRARACSSPGKDAGYAEHARGATLELELGQGAPAPASGFKGKAKRTAAKVASEVKHAMDGPEPEPEPAIAQPVRAPAPAPAPSLTLRRQATATKHFLCPVWERSAKNGGSTTCMAPGCGVPGGAVFCTTRCELCTTLLLLAHKRLELKA